MAFYEQHAEHAASVFEASPGNTVKAFFRPGDPVSAHQDLCDVDDHP